MVKEMPQILNKYRYMDIFAVLAIGIIYTWNLPDVSRILIIDDEFVYWGIGATMAGFDWKDLLSVSQYYSFGYSFILVPLFLLVKIGLSMKLALKIAVIFNAVFIVGSYFISIQIIELLFVEEPVWLKKIVGLFSVLYIGNLIHMNMAWVETWLIFVYWLLILFLVKFIQFPNYKNAFVLILTTAYIFTIHMRALGIVIAVAIILLLFVIFNLKKMNKMLLVFISITSGIMGLVVIMLKGFITNSIFSGSEQVVNSVNNVSVNVKNTGSLFNINGLIDLIMSMLGKLFYAGSASFLLATVGFVFAVSILGKALINEMRGEKIWQLKEWIISFSLLSFLAENGISAIFKCFKYFSQGVTIDKWDTIVFGRYSDFVIGPMIILGLYAICNIKKYSKEIMISALFYICCAVSVQFQFDILAFHNGTENFSFRNLSAIWMNIICRGELENFAYYVMAITIVVFVILCLSGILKQRNVLGMFLLSICVFWGICGVNNTTEHIKSKESKDKYVETIYDIINTTEGTQIYFVYDSLQNNGINIKNLQWMLGERTVHMENIQSGEYISNANAVVLCDTSEIKVMAALSEQMEYIYNSGEMAVFVSQDNSYYNEIKEKAQEMKAIANPIIYSIDLNDIITEYSYIKMNGDMYYNYNASEGAYLTENMGIVLDDGIYEFSIEMRARDCVPGKDIGYITVGEVNEEVQHIYPLKVEEFIEKERNTIKVSVEIEGYKEPYIGIYTYGEAAIRIYDIYYQKIYNNLEIKSEEVEELLRNVPLDASICYVDSDDSAESGFPYHSVYQWSYIGGKMLPYKKYFKDNFYLVEKTEILENNIILETMQIEQETDNYFLLRN